MLPGGLQVRLRLLNVGAPSAKLVKTGRGGRFAMSKPAEK